MSFRLSSAATMLLMLITAAAGAASAGEKRTDPADPDAAVPPQNYRSDFASYRKPQFEQKIDWRTANDTVRDVGGHAGAMQDTDAQTGVQAAPAPGQSTMHHHGHMGHGGRK